MTKPSSTTSNDTNINVNHQGQTTATTSTFQVAFYMVIFFTMMIIHEVALEAASTSFHHLDSLASTVTLFQFGFCFILPLIATKGGVWATFPNTWRATFPYVQLSLLVFGATGLATQSLKYVSYPTKVVFKSAKLIPTMIVSTVLLRKNSSSGNGQSKYGPLDYFAALLLCLGAAGYSYNSSSNVGGDEKNTSIYGISLLLVSIVCDALVPNLQQKLMSSHPSNKYTTSNSSNTSTNHYEQQEQEQLQSSLIPTSTISTTAFNDKKDIDISKKEIGLSAQTVMVNTNAVGFGSILIYMLLSGSLLDAITTATVNPMLLFYLVCVGVGLSTAVLAYTKLIKASGSVVAVAVSTLRKVATVLLSYVIFPKPILPIHVFSGLLVLTGVLIATFCRKKQ